MILADFSIRSPSYPSLLFLFGFDSVQVFVDLVAQRFQPAEIFAAHFAATGQRNARNRQLQCGHRQAVLCRESFVFGLFEPGDIGVHLAFGQAVELLFLRQRLFLVRFVLERKRVTFTGYFELYCLLLGHVACFPLNEISSVVIVCLAYLPDSSSPIRSGLLSRVMHLSTSRIKRLTRAIALLWSGAFPASPWLSCTDEYQKYFEKDKALERRFQIVMVNEPDTLSTISILRGLKERYENHHHVRIKDDAIIAAVELSNRYITDRFLPDKAIDLMDEAAAKLRMEVDSVPEELDEISRKIKQLEIEREAIKRENDKPKLEQIGKELAELKEQENSYKAKWQSEKTLVNKIQQNKVEIENLKFEADKAEREGDYGRVAEIRYGKLQALNQEIEETQQKLHEMQGDKAMIKEEVDAEDIADVVSRWTGIPVSKMLQSEKDKLLHLEAELHQRVIGQDEAIEAVSDAVRRSRAGLQDPKRPIGSFLFLGTTGVGKTELAKALAEFLFDDETMMTRIDMSEYQEKHSVSRLVGAPPGYVGYDEGGQLTEAVRRKPYSVVLFDEIEKAHPDVFNILLQVLDDGRLTDNKGRTVNFKNTIIIMTSNMGSGYIQSQMEKLNSSNKEQIVEETKKEVMNMLKKTIRPEFLNRIDETIMFLPLTEPEIKQIVVLQIKSVQKMLSGNGVELVLTNAAIDFLANAGYDPEFGARPVKRAIQHYLLNDLSKKLLAQEVDRSKPITVDANTTDDGLVFRN